MTLLLILYRLFKALSKIMREQNGVVLFLVYLLMLPSLSAMVRIGERTKFSQKKKSAEAPLRENQDKRELIYREKFSNKNSLGDEKEEGILSQERRAFDSQNIEAAQEVPEFYLNEIAQKSTIQNLKNLAEFEKYRKELESILSEIERREDEIDKTSDEAFASRAALYATAYIRLQAKLSYMISFLGSYPEFGSREDIELLARSSVALIISAYGAIDMRRFEPLKIRAPIAISSPVNIPFRLVSPEIMDSYDHEIEQKIDKAEAVIRILRAIEESQSDDNRGSTLNQAVEANYNFILQQTKEACVTAAAIKILFAKRTFIEIHKLPNSFKIAESEQALSQGLSSLQINFLENEKMKLQLAGMEKDLNLFFHLEHERLFADKLIRKEREISSNVKRQLAASQQELEVMRAQATRALAPKNGSWFRRFCISLPVVVPSVIPNQLAKMERLKEQQEQHARNIERLWRERDGHIQRIEMLSHCIGNYFSKIAAAFDQEPLQQQFRLLFHEESFRVGCDVVKSLFYFSGIDLNEMRWEKLREAITREFSER